jgi:polyisoprenoid-binding protein YceI
MRRGLKVVLLGIVGLVVLVAGALAVYYVFIQEDPPARVALTPRTTAEQGAEPAADTPEGTWQVQRGENSFLGYRVNERLFSLPAPTDAVGRTPAVDGTMTIAGASVESAEVTGDLRRLESDRSQRDNRIRTDGLESDRFPEATFVLTEPVDIGTPAVGEDVRATATGDLTLHGVTRPVEVSLQARWSGDTIEVVGTLPIVFADYEIDPPNIANFVSVEDEGEMELMLTFARA